MLVNSGLGLDDSCTVRRHAEGCGCHVDDNMEGKLTILHAVQSTKHLPTSHGSGQNTLSHPPPK